MLGWKVKSFPELEVSLRQRGAKFGFEYYGKSAYMRHVPYLYVLAGAARMYLLGKRMMQGNISMVIRNQLK